MDADEKLRTGFLSKVYTLSQRYEEVAPTGHAGINFIILGNKVIQLSSDGKHDVLLVRSHLTARARILSAVPRINHDEKFFLAGLRARRGISLAVSRRILLIDSNRERII